MAIRDEAPVPAVAYARLDYLFRIGVFVVAAAVVATTLVRGAVGAFDLVPPTFVPLWWSQVIGATVVGSAGGVFAYAVLDRFTDRTERNFLAVAAVVLLLSTGPLWIAGRMDGATMESILILAVLHITVAAVTVFLLIRMDRGVGLEGSVPLPI